MRFVTLILFMCLTAPAAFAEVIFEDDFSDGIDDAWSVPSGAFTSTRNGWLLGYGSGPKIGAGGPEHLEYVVSFDFMMDNEFLYMHLETHSSADPATTSHPDIPNRGDLTCTYDDNNLGPGHWYVNDNLFDGDSRSYSIGSPTLQAGIWYTVRFGIVGNQIVFRLEGNDQIIEDQVFPVRPGLTRTNGSWSIDATGNTTFIVDNFLVEGSGPVASKSKSMGDVKSMFR